MIKKSGLRAVFAGAVVVFSAAAFSGCSAGGTTAGDDGPTTVKIGMSPYFEYMPWIVADKLGLDKKQGLSFEFTTFDATDKAAVAAYRGDIDVAPACHACSMPLMKQLPDLVDWMITDQFKGFILIGRSGQTKTFEDMEKKVGEEKAKKEILQSLKGKSFAIKSSSYKALLASALEQIGLTTDDIKILDFQSDSQAALAFAGGTGDYYMGSLPEEAKLLAESDKYVNVGGTEVLGDAGLWFSTMVAKGSWLKDNQDTVLKLMAVWYRTMRYMAEKPDTTLPIYTKAINKATASKMPVDQIETITTQLDRFATLDQAKDEFYSPSAPTYYKRSLDFYVKGNAKVLPKDYDVDVAVQDKKYFEKLLKSTALVDWIKSPL